VTTVGGVAASAASAGQAARPQGLGKEDFLRLLVAQLRHQSPLAPMDNLGFIAQLAQFSALEQMANLNQAIMLGQAVSLIGLEVRGESPGLGAFAGRVLSVRLDGGVPLLNLGDVEVRLEAIRQVAG